MAHETTPHVTPTPPAPAPVRPAAHPRQSITGVTPPAVREARIREEWPTMIGVVPGLAGLGRRLIQTYFLAPVGILLLAPGFLLKFGPFVCRRYTLTNRRLMIQQGWKPAVVKQVPLADIDDVRISTNGVDPFYVSGTLEIVSKEQVVMSLFGVPEPEGFRQAIMNAVYAWVPQKADQQPFQAASAVK